MSKLSVLIPTRNELFLSQTVNDIFKKAAGEIEVIVSLDEYWPNNGTTGSFPDDNPNLIIIRHGRRQGMRGCINGAARVATGDYFLKCDAHCMFDEGFDEVLKADCDKDWIVIPSRYSLDAEEWKPNLDKTRIDYHYLCYPYDKKDAVPGMHGVIWAQRAKERSDPQYDIDDEMSFQGSCWFMSRYHYWEFLGGMDSHGYGTFSQEPQEIGLKTWLGGGQIKVNKKTWYAHLHKGRRYGRMYSFSGKSIKKGHQYAVDLWMYNGWEDRVHDIDWLIDKFWPVPTWPENWKEVNEEKRGWRFNAEAVVSNT
jgi:glycosyltransferase involved in cell wall biosynthesis